MSQSYDLRELIHSKGLPLRKAGMSGQGMSNVMVGRLGLGPNGIAKIAATLGVTTEEVFAAYQETRRRLEAAKTQPVQGVA